MFKRCLLLLLCTQVSAYSAAQPGAVASEAMVREGAMVQLGDHTYAIPDANVPAVPNVGIVVGERATLVIDPGLGRKNGEIVLREAAKVSDNRELYIVSTHFHPEHTVGYNAFPDSAKYINSTVQEAEFAESGMRFVELFARRSASMADLLEGAERRVADIIFDKDYVLDLGGVTVTMLVVGPTHTRGDTGFFVVEDQVLFAGDVVMNNSFVAANSNSSMTAWLAALDAFAAMQPRTVVPAHGEIGDGSTLIPALRGILTEIRAQALALKQQGKSAEQAAGLISQELRAKHPDWPRANGIAPLAQSAWQEG